MLHNSGCELRTRGTARKRVLCYDIMTSTSWRRYRILSSRSAWIHHGTAMVFSADKAASERRGYSPSWSIQGLFSLIVNSFFFLRPFFSQKRHKKAELLSDYGGSRSDAIRLFRRREDSARITKLQRMTEAFRYRDASTLCL